MQVPMSVLLTVSKALPSSLEGALLLDTLKEWLPVFVFRLVKIVENAIWILACR